MIRAHKHQDYMTPNVGKNCVMWNVPEQSYGRNQIIPKPKYTCLCHAGALFWSCVCGSMIQKRGEKLGEARVLSGSGEVSFSKISPT